MPLEMDRICAVVDAQGFIVDQCFLARECAIIANNFSHVQEFDISIPWNEISEINQKSIDAIERYVTGIPFYSLTKRGRESSPIPDYSKVANFLKTHYQMLASDEKPYFGVKNNLLKKILDEANIPSYDLTDETPSVLALDKMYDTNWTCALHTSKRRLPPLNNGRRRRGNYRFAHNYRCAYRKCINFWNYISTIAQPSS